jgi:alpha-glucosidase (family GH31 glycosyl hydrolase)
MLLAAPRFAVRSSRAFAAGIFSLAAALLPVASVPARAAELAPRPKWTLVAPGVWKATIGSPEDFTLLSAAGQEPMVEALAAMPAAIFPLAENEIEGRPDARHTVLRFPLALDEDIYGLGVDFLSLRRTGSVFQLHEDHWGGRPGRTHAPVPFYVSTQGYGVLIDSARYLDVHVGLSVRLAAKEKPPVIDRTTGGRQWSSRPRSDSVEIAVPAAGVVVYVFAGPTPLDAVRRYNLFCGGGALPPKWGLGFLTRTPTAYTAQQALAEVDAFRERGIPLDMLGLEPGWQDHAYPCSFEWDAKRFPDPAGFLAELEKRHVRANLWFNPYVSPTAPLYTKLLPFAGSHLVWNGIVPDYTLPEPRKIFGDHLLKTVVSVNPVAIGGFKIDEVDGNDQWMWPDYATFPSGHDGEQLRQTYGVLLQRTVLDVFRGLNRRTLGQVRGTNGGTSSFPFVIYNDNYDFNEYITAVANTSFAGVLWSPEVRAGTGEDMLRRVQAVCFSPLALFNGWATETKLWSHADVAGPIRDTIMLRQRLLPYWYTTFAQYHYQGTPVIRAMPLIAGFKAPGATAQAGKLDATTNPYAIGTVTEVKNQYLVGDALLVAPIAPGVTSRKVSLPPGRWYNFYTGKLAGENETIEVTPPLAQIPLFVKDGALIPLTAERQWAPGRDEMVPLEIRHYGEKAGELSLYDDDGETFDYERGVSSWTKLSVAKDTAGVWRGEVTPTKDGRPWHYSTVTWRFMTTTDATH